MDLSELVCAFLTLGGLANLGFAYLLWSRNGARRLPLNQGRSSATDGPVFAMKSGIVFSLMGAGQLIIVLMLLVGPWRKIEPEIFPMRVLDLNAPPAAVETTLASNAAVSPS